MFSTAQCGKHATLHYYDSKTLYIPRYIPFLSSRRNRVFARCFFISCDGGKGGWELERSGVCIKTGCPISIIMFSYPRAIAANIIKEVLIEINDNLQAPCFATSQVLHLPPPPRSPQGCTPKLRRAMEYSDEGCFHVRGAPSRETCTLPSERIRKGILY